MKIFKWNIQFSKLIVFLVLMYCFRISEFVIKTGDSYSLVALISMWGASLSATVGFYIWYSKNANASWNDEEAKYFYNKKAMEDDSFTTPIETDMEFSVPMETNMGFSDYMEGGDI